MGKKKKDGKIFTPKPIVKYMLYNSLWRHHELDQHIIDNSCGDGAFLCEIVSNYCETYKFEHMRKGSDFKTTLETYIHGIEIDPVEHKKCLENLDAVAEKYGIKDVKWDVQNRDALSCHDYDGKMDYVIANPPYIRTHDLVCDLSGYSFTENGMKDIYLAFYELGFRMLKDSGSMCYIAPSSWFTSLAGQKMRDYVMKNKYLYSVHDLGHARVFENATTYVAICVFRKFKYPYRQPDQILYRKGDNKMIQVSYDDMCIDGKFYFGTPEQLKQMREIIDYGKNLKTEDKAFEVKNGFATLADDIFITENTLRVQAPEWEVPKREHLIHAYKSSTGKLTYCIYPYKDGKLVSEETLKKNSPDEYEWLVKHRERLETRATTEPWYAFGRTQAINDVDTQKFPIRSLVRNVDDVRLVEAGRGIGVYGGLYILPKYKIGTGVKADLLEMLKSQDFISYVKLLGKYKSGGYYTFSSKELENYLNYKYEQWKKSTSM